MVEIIVRIDKGKLYYTAETPGFSEVVTGDTKELAIRRLVKKLACDPHYKKPLNTFIKSEFTNHEVNLLKSLRKSNGWVEEGSTGKMTRPKAVNADGKAPRKKKSMKLIDILPDSKYMTAYELKVPYGALHNEQT